MPQELTLEQLVSDVRDWLQIFDQATLRDGFADDPVDDDGNPYRSTSIVTWINRAYTEFLETGFCKCYVTIQTTAGVAEYRLKNDVHEIVDASIDGSPLKHITVLNADRDLVKWRDLSLSGNKGLPTQYATYASDTVVLFPCPDAVYSVKFLADVTAADLVARNDKPVRIPVRYQPALAARAALLLNSMVRLENPMSEKVETRATEAWQFGYSGLTKLSNARGDDEVTQIAFADYRSPLGI